MTDKLIKLKVWKFLMKNNYASLILKKIQNLMFWLTMFCAVPIASQVAVAQVDLAQVLITQEKKEELSKSIQDENERLQPDEKASESVQNEDALPRFPLTISKFHVMPKYYSTAWSLKMGYFYRKNDTSIFPNVALNMMMDDGIVLNTSVGFLFQKNFFTWEVDAVYDVLPFTMNQGYQNQIAYAKNVFAFYINKLKLSAMFRIGKTSQLTKDDEKKRSVDFESQGIRLDAFLLDIGFFRSTLVSAFFVDWRPNNNFANYRLLFNAPQTFNLYYVDLSLMYSFYATGLLNSKTIYDNIPYIIEQKQSVMTARESFRKEERYSMFHLFASEIRWYPTRCKDKAHTCSYHGATIERQNEGIPKYNLIAKTNGFFISFFADIGVGITQQYRAAFLAEYGVGLGYTLFDCVPFTFQVGLNQRGYPVFFLAVISRMVHMP